MSEFEVVINGLCGECQQEVYSATYGVGQGEAEYQVAIDVARSATVIVAEYWDDFQPVDGHITFELCKRHLGEAAAALEGEENEEDKTD